MAEVIRAETMFDGVTQRTLWRGLITELRDCLPVELLMYVKQMQVTKSEDSNVRIQDNGVADQKQGSVMTVSWMTNKGEQTARMPLDWAWKGRMWNQVDEEITIDLRLEIEAKDGSLKFIFHPVRLEDKKTEMVRWVVDQLRATLGDAANVYEGGIGGK